MIWFKIWLVYAVFFALPFMVAGSMTIKSHPRLNDRMMKFAPLVMIGLYAPWMIALVVFVWVAL